MTAVKCDVVFPVVIVCHTPQHCERECVTGQFVLKCDINLPQSLYSAMVHIFNNYSVVRDRTREQEGCREFHRTSQFLCR